MLDGARQCVCMCKKAHLDLVAVVVQQQVCRLEVAMHHPVGVQVVQALTDRRTRSRWWAGAQGTIVRSSVLQTLSLHLIVCRCAYTSGTRLPACQAKVQAPLPLSAFPLLCMVCCTCSYCCLSFLSCLSHSLTHTQTHTFTFTLSHLQHLPHVLPHLPLRQHLPASW